MLMYGGIEMAQVLLSQPIYDKIIVYNLSALTEFYPRIYLLPPNSLGISYDYQFDVNYMNWIINTDQIFVEFMKIISALYNGMDVYLIISPEDWSENIADSLMKLIQDRYGVVGVRLTDFEDYKYANDNDFSEVGLINVISDMERYSMITYKKQ